MNNILQLKGQFEYQKNASGFGAVNLPVGGSVTSVHVEKLQKQLEKILDVWTKNTLIDGALVSVHYRNVVAKSNRIKGLFVNKASMNANDSIRGAKFEGDFPKINHVFTHYISLDILKESIRRLDICAKVIEKQFNGKITHDDIITLNKEKYYRNSELSFNNFLNVVVDSYHVRNFAIDQDVEEIKDQSIITIYKTNLKTIDLFHKLGIDIVNPKIIDETTIQLDPYQLSVLKEKAPYLIAMQTKDLSQINKEDVIPCENKKITIPSPKNEPIIGVIDTLFDKNVYFSEWVTFENMVDKEIPTNKDDFNHGTAVSSLIVDGPSINPHLDDGCGRFRVKHFGVATHGFFSSFSVLKSIREAVAKNRDIKVWNLSLGSAMEIPLNFISPEAAELDRIQSEYDVIFIVAGTNKPVSIEKKRIGAPADSINSIVVNSVKRNKQPASYFRVGPVLSFFHKPDVSYYGGDSDEQIRVCTPTGEGFSSGTSFAAPWITRKVAFLIYNMGLSREVAKALIIDSAAGWNRKDDLTHSIGYGVVPIRIEDIVQTPNDEIRFIMTGSTDSYETYTYNIPVPAYMDKHPFFARATLCYFPRCSRNQGVDYTDTEMDIHFGRVAENSKGIEIKSINNNRQGNIGLNSLYEGEARKLYRKWDNIKHISDMIKERAVARKKYGAGYWGLSIKTKERLTSSHDKGTQFGVVITLKEMNGVNRIDDFIKLCMVRGWIVNRIDVNNQINIYNKAEEQIDFE